MNNFTSNETSNSSLVRRITRINETAHRQCILIQNSLRNCFDICIQGLDKTQRSVEGLHSKDPYFFTRAVHLKRLKDEITEIQIDYDRYIKEALEKFNKEKEHCKEILLSMINELEALIDTNKIRKCLLEMSVMISNIILNDPLFSVFDTSNPILLIIRLIFKVSVPDFVNDFTGGLTFREKLEEIIRKISVERSAIIERKEMNLSKIVQYFKTFIDNTQNLSVMSTIKIVWYDASIKNDENQSYVKQIQNRFPANTLIPCDDHERLIRLIKEESASQIICITSGKMGQSNIDKIGYYWNLKGVIIFCRNMNYHRKWAKPYKKITLVTNRFCDVLNEIQNIISGNSYFVKYGFTYDDIYLSLNTTHNPEYYLSREKFIISDFSEINSGLIYQKLRIQQLYTKIQEKNPFRGKIPGHFDLEKNLFPLAEKFVQILNDESLTPIENQIIKLYSQESSPCLYRVINDILNLLDEELILLFGDYIKALRYSLIKYIDNEPKMKNVNKIYRGIYLNEKSSEDFLKKFKLHDYIIFPSFLSTSINETATSQFIHNKGVLLEISIDTIHNADNKPKCIKAVSEFASEEEVLINCFSMLKVNDIKKSTEDLYVYECSLENNIFSKRGCPIS